MIGPNAQLALTLEETDHHLKEINRERLQQLDPEVAEWNRHRDEQEVTVKVAKQEPKHAAPAAVESPDANLANMDRTLATALSRLLVTMKANPRAEPEPPKAELAKVVKLPAFHQDTRPTVNLLARSALFAAIQGKDRKVVWEEKIATDRTTEVFFSGEQLNQDDHDTLMQLVFMASHRPLGDYVAVPAHSILKALGRGTGGRQHEQLKGEIERLVKGGVGVKTSRFNYIGHLIDDAIQDKDNRYWVYRLNPKLAPFYGLNAYTLINWEQRKQLRGKDLARWLQLYLATHAEPFPISVEFIRQSSGSRNPQLSSFRRQLRKALDDLKANGDLSAWKIDTADKVHFTRTPSPTQARHIIGKITGSTKKGRKDRKL